jgi:hypothetical protein
MILAIDFDGTLHDGTYFNIGMPKPGAVKYMKKIKDEGHYIIIWTCREGDKQQKMKEWLKKKEIPYNVINDNNPVKTAEYKSNSRKVFADMYIDDKNILGVPSWDKIYNMISNKSNGLKRNSLFSNPFAIKIVN